MTWRGWLVVGGGVWLMLLNGCGGAPSAPLRKAAPPVDRSGPEEVPAVDPAVMNKLTTELSRVLATRGITLDIAGRPAGKRFSSVPARSYRTPQRTEVGPVSQLYWLNFQVGDYDQNGEVNIADLTPVGVHYGKTSASPDWVGGAEVADGDGNGEINISDVTPLGMNFGVQVDGFVIEAREGTGEWREYGYMPFNAGFPTGSFLEYGYNAPSGAIEAEFRVVPAGRVRDLTWDTYTLTGDDAFVEYIALAVIGGKPVLTYSWADSTQAEHAGFAMATTARPASAADWIVEPDLLLDQGSNIPPALASVEGYPVLSYSRYQPATQDYGIYFSRRDDPSAPGATWTTHAVATSLPNPVRTATVVREGRPAILYEYNGLHLLQGLLDFPTVSAQWNWINANPAINDLRSVVALANGPYLFACGATVQPSDYLSFNRSKVPAPSQASDFSEYLLAPDASTTMLAGLVLIGGVPAIAYSDEAAHAVQFLLAANREVDSAANWFIHQAVLSTGTDEHWYPTLCLVGGRPAITSGYHTLDFHWSGGQWPDATAEWQTQRIADSTGAFGSALVATDGLPLVAYTSETGGHYRLTIAVAREQSLSPTTQPSL